ncbi:Vegetative incompatibility protein [Lachnellula occidentalis]|uniref:Vegetative incompatibility protein n=1 Tax=Lachnellula occidentalis TaxID=215460 RepID=A0A8H8S515_9HELO|nr:Vegetative incompatibility protein [Lachnellula occidentalis]
MATVSTANPNSIFETAYRKLKDSVSSADASAFQSTSFEEVWKAAEEIEKAHEARGNLRNMRRIAPFLKGLQNYAKVIEVLCNGTPYMPWIWAPVKLMLQLADQYTSIFDKLLDAYRQIAEVMPQFGRLQTAFSNDPNFQVVLGLVYSDILDFHRRAYKFFGRRSFHLFFDSMWKSFEFRFSGILKNFARHRDLVMREVVTIDVVEARELRIKLQQELEQQERKTQNYYLHDSISWLKLPDEEHDDELDRLAEKRQEGTCEWVFRNPLFQSWKIDAHSDAILWVKGIPGAGKTILSSHIIHQMREEGRFTTAYHLCNSYTTGKHLFGELMRGVIVQLLRANPDLAPYIFENYANKALAPTAARVKGLLEKLVQAIPSIRIIVDGLDEYPLSDQRTILNELLSLSKLHGAQCRILFSNRESENINKRLNGRPTISLRDQDVDLKNDIGLYVHAELDRLRGDFGNALIDRIERQIVAKADGMFLWVRLMMQSLEECHSPQELVESVNTLPEGLDKAYKRILDDLQSRSSDKSIRILQWIACSFRIMKVHEIKDGVVLQMSGAILNEQTKLVDSFWEHCKPLIEKGPKNTIDFVHYSAKEYVLHETSGPFLGFSEAQHGLAISCLNYMNSSYCFINSAVSNQALEMRVLKGYHGLHHYANEFWFQHLLQYTKAGDPVEDEELDMPLWEIREFWKQEPGIGAGNLKLDDTTSADKINAQLEALASTPLAQYMGLDILTFQKFLSQESSSHQAPAKLKDEELRHDPTHFSDISQHYQNIVRTLMDCPVNKPPEGIHPQELHTFKQTYVDSAFICRYRECPRYSDGFKTSEDRDNHEKIHTKPLRCADPKCEFFARGFVSKTGLLKHNRKYHPSPEEEAPPAFEPRQAPEPPLVLPPDPALALALAPPLPVPSLPLVPNNVPNSRYQEQAMLASTPRRVSMAKKGLKVHNCNLCTKIFTRAEGLRRHKLTHEDPKYPCLWENCGRAFFRLDLLERHQQVQQHERNANQTGNVTGQESN